MLVYSRNALGIRDELPFDPGDLHFLGNRRRKDPALSVQGSDGAAWDTVPGIYGLKAI